MMEALSAPLCFRHNCKGPSDGEDRLIQELLHELSWEWEVGP